MTGKIKNLPEGKNFGFIDSRNKDYFFHREDFDGHWDDLIKDFRSGKEIEVEFEEAHSPKGLRASSVKRTRFPDA